MPWANDARSLTEYMYHILDGMRLKARINELIRHGYSIA